VVIRINDAVELYGFSCRSCTEAWNGDYQVRRVTHGSGERWVMYSRHGSPCEPPAITSPACRRCGAPDVDVRLLTGTETAATVLP
jgi:hypothetical protein